MSKNLEQLSLWNSHREENLSQGKYIINSYKFAQRIIDNFSINEKYLRSLVRNVTSNGDLADSLSYGNLLKEGRKIRGIALKILKSKK